MKDERKFVFVGNREYVLRTMIRMELNISSIWVMNDSFLLKSLQESEKIDFEVIYNRCQLLDNIINTEFDILVSNGCEYILPITEICKKKNINIKFINIHPSLLPDLKGKSPINGALLFGRRHGVTCHYMDDEVDSGEIISQIEIPVTDDVNLDLLYKLSFQAEGDVFELAYKKDFVVEKKEDPRTSYIYYSRKEQDCLIYLDDDLEIMKTKVRAFCCNGQYAKIQHGGRLYSIYDIKEIKNSYVKDKYKKHKNNSVCLLYGEKYVLVKICETMVQFCIEHIEGIQEQDNFID